MTNPYAAWWQTWFKTWEMALAAPVVIALRLQGIAAAGLHPSARDRREMSRMGQEKVAAAYEGSAAAARAAARSTQALWQQPWAMAAVAVAPAHRRVVANRRRLMR